MAASERKKERGRGEGGSSWPISDGSEGEGEQLAGASHIQWKPHNLN